MRRIADCPLNAAWLALGGKWKFTILYWLAERPCHFAALRRQLAAVSDGISQKVLVQQLRELIAEGLVSRQPTGRVPAPVIYALTDYGATALPMIEAARVWGTRHLARLDPRQIAPSCAVARPLRQAVE
ncbi:MAG TPA: helix-turn-helix domain-containing protein [Rhizomicrobium sp.]|nr:helix-turn-helix domain-containing protein [Rhizomicrobium sp.]